MKMDLEGFYLVELARRHQTLIISFINVGVGLVVLRKWCAGGVCKSKAKLHGKTAIITGANVGIGKETARDLAGRGAKVIMACRDLQKAEHAAAEIKAATRSDKVVVRKLDLASMTSIRKFANEILDTEKEVNLLINNAGIMMCPEWKTEDGFEMQFGVNHLGHFLLTNLLLDKIKKSAPARIVNVSSNAHEAGKMNFDDLHSRKSYSFSQAYANSKLANVLFSRELSKRLTGTNVTVNSLHPGVINTELTRHLSTTLGVVLYTVLTPVRILFKTPWQGAQTTIYCAVSEDVADVTGKYFADCGITKESKAAQSDADAKRLWEISEEMVGLKSR